MTVPYRFYTTLRVRFNETDLQGHVNFGWYLMYFDVAIVAYLRALGYSYQQLLDDGFDMLYVDAHAAYHAPAYFDETLQVHCRLGNIGNTSMRFDIQIYEQADERLISTGEVSVVMVARESREKVSVPMTLRQAVRSYEGPAVDEIMEAKEG